VFIPSAARSLSSRQRQVLLDSFPFFLLPPYRRRVSRQSLRASEIIAGKHCKRTFVFVALWLERLAIVLSGRFLPFSRIVSAPDSTLSGSQSPLSLFIHDRCRRVSDARKTKKERENATSHVGRVGKLLTSPSASVVELPVRERLPYPLNE